MMMLIPGIKSKIIIMIVLYFDMIFCCHCHCVISVILYLLRYGYEYKKYFFFYDNSYTCIVINVIKLNLIINNVWPSWYDIQGWRKTTSPLTQPSVNQPTQLISI